MRILTRPPLILILCALAVGAAGSLAFQSAFSRENDANQIDGFAHVTARRLEAQGIVVELPGNSTSPKLSESEIRGVVGKIHEPADIGDVDFVLLTLTNGDALQLSRHPVWAISLTAIPSFHGPAGTAEDQLPVPSGYFWVEFYDAATGERLLGYSGDY